MKESAKAPPKTAVLSLAQLLAVRIGAAYVRIDTIETAIADEVLLARQSSIEVARATSAWARPASRRRWSTASGRSARTSASS